MEDPVSRTEAEQEEIMQQEPVKPAWLTTLGWMDWQWEKELLKGEYTAHHWASLHRAGAGTGDPCGVRESR